MKTIYREYDIETNADGKVISVTKDGVQVENLTPDTAEGAMSEIDKILGKPKDGAKTKKETKPKPPKKMSEAEGIADRKKQSGVVQGKNKTYDKEGEYDWSSLDEKTLRDLFKQMQAASGTKIADIPDGATIEQIRTTCKNVHNYFRVKAAEVEYFKQNQQNKATKQENTMAKKAVKKTAKKTAAKAKKTAAAPKVAKFAGFPLDAKVTVKNKTNPAREGNAKWKRWDTVLSGKYKTIGDLKKAKANPGTIRNAVKAKSITVG